jgi:hypothetical protein
MSDHSRDHPPFAFAGQPHLDLFQYQPHFQVGVDHAVALVAQQPVVRD